MSGYKLMPRFRFRSLEMPYTTYRLKNIASFFKGKGYSKKDLVSSGYPIILYGRMYTNYKLNIKNITDTFVKDDIESFKSKQGDVIIPASGETAKDISIASNIEEKGIIIGGDLNVIRPNRTMIDSTFLALNLSNGKLKKELVKKAQGKSIVHLHNTDLMDIYISLPSISEQQKIGDFFAKLDRLLDLQQQKLDQLGLMKKFLLQKLFPKQGAKIPELRFKGFKEEWETKELQEISKIVGGGTPDTNKPEYWSGNINWYSPTEIGKKAFVYSSSKKISELGLKKSSATLHPANTTVLFTSRAGIGNMAILKKAAATNQGFQSMELKDGVFPYFVYSYGFEIKRKAKKLASGSTFLEISNSDMKRITLEFPSTKEQQKIGNLLAKVDRLIELENKKLHNLKQVKKSLLQNMFIE